MKFLSGITIVLLIFAFGNFALTQHQKDIDWKTIKILVTNRSDVEKIHGEGEEYGYWQLYKTSYGVILVDYTTAENCKSLPASEWNVPIGTVTEISYHFDEKQPKLSELGISKKDYKIRPHGTDLPDYKEYYNEEKGIEIIFNEKTKEVSTINLSPSVKDEKERQCS